MHLKRDPFEESGCSLWVLFNMADEDFEEEEVWSYVKDSREVIIPSASSTSATTSRMKSRANAHEEHGRSSHRQSAPVNIPDWSKTSGPNGHEAHNDDDDDDDRVPPHEWLAKKLARSQISSFSVCEGAGRTLKGRDQRKVRNAVLTRTGFLE